MLFYGALESIAVLLEQSYWVLAQDASTGNFLQPGLLSIGYFATALITNQLARRLILNERLARQRGADLADQLRINRLIIRDVQDGVLVVDANGLVHLHNPRAADLLGRVVPELSQAEAFSEELAQRLAARRAGQAGSSGHQRNADIRRLIRVRQYLQTFIEEFARNEGQIPSQSFSVEAGDDATVEFDRAHLNQVLWNLLHNAWRHCRKRAGSVRIAVLRRANRVELHVIDDGEGVPKALQVQLFEPFFTTFASGTGLGLYIARELCAANGASLDYLDRGPGADFRILWQEP